MTKAKRMLYFERLKEYSQSQLFAIIEDEDTDAYTAKALYELSKLNPPLCFQGPGSVEIKYDKEFISFSLMLSRELGVDAKKMSVMEYFSSYDELKRTLEEKAKMYSIRASMPF